MEKLSRILIIDDSPFDRLIAQKVVSIAAIAEKCTVVDSALAALDYLKQHARCDENFPDVIFVDICMPAMDGFAFLDEFERLSAGFPKQCPIYILSSSVDPNDIRRSQKSECVSGFILKPFTVEKAHAFLNAHSFRRTPTGEASK